VTSTCPAQDQTSGRNRCPSPEDRFSGHGGAPDFGRGCPGPRPPAALDRANVGGRKGGAPAASPNRAARVRRRHRPLEGPRDARSARARGLEHAADGEIRLDVADRVLGNGRTGPSSGSERRSARHAAPGRPWHGRGVSGRPPAQQSLFLSTGRGPRSGEQPGSPLPAEAPAPARKSAISLSPAQIRRTPPASPSPNATAKFAKYRYSMIFGPPPNRPPPSFGCSCPRRCRSPRSSRPRPSGHRTRPGSPRHRRSS
jgi:hypothetical protein